MDERRHRQNEPRCPGLGSPASEWRYVKVLIDQALEQQFNPEGVWKVQIDEEVERQLKRMLGLHCKISVSELNS